VRIASRNVSNDIYLHCCKVKESEERIGRGMTIGRINKINSNGIWGREKREGIYIINDDLMNTVLVTQNIVIVKTDFNL
jgi:hypothetical protein